MKVISVNVSESVYSEFQEYAQRMGLSASALIREAMEKYRSKWIKPRKSLKQLTPLKLGKVKQSLRSDDDLLGEMLDDMGN